MLCIPMIQDLRGKLKENPHHLGKQNKTVKKNKQVMFRLGHTALPHQTHRVCVCVCMCLERDKETEGDGASTLTMVSFLS